MSTKIKEKHRVFCVSNHFILKVIFIYVTKTLAIYFFWFSFFSLFKKCSCSQIIILLHYSIFWFWVQAMHNKPIYMFIILQFVPFSFMQQINYMSLNFICPQTLSSLWKWSQVYLTGIIYSYLPVIDLKCIFSL